MHAVIIGGSGGIGRAFIQHLQEQYLDCSIQATFHRHEPQSFNQNCHWHCVDITQESSVENFCAQLGEVDLCINAAGMLHDDEHGPEKSVRHINEPYFMKSMSINTLPTLLLAKYMAAHFKHRRPAVFASVSARVGSIEENDLGGWYSYRASKAALNMILKTLSIEWKRSLPNVVVAALHPGTTDTPLSRPFQQNVAADHLFSPAKSVNYMMQIIDRLEPSDSGKFWSFDGEILPW